MLRPRRAGQASFREGLPVKYQTNMTIEMLQSVDIDVESVARAVRCTWSTKRIGMNAVKVATMSIDVMRCCKMSKELSHPVGQVYGHRS